MKNIDTESSHITPVGGNVFLDLGFAPDEAVALQAEAQKIIAEKFTAREKVPPKEDGV